MYSFAGLVKHIHAIVIPRQRKLMGSSAQNSSGVHWCRRRARFNEVPEKVPEKVPDKVPEKVWQPLVQVRFDRVPKKVPEKVWEALVQSQVRCGRLWCKARCFNRVLEKVPEALVQSQVRFNRVPEVQEKVPGSLGAQPSQVQRVPEKVAETKPGQVHLTHGKSAEVFPALGFPARFRKICKNKTLRLLGIPPKLSEAYICLGLSIHICIDFSLISFLH